MPQTIIYKYSNFFSHVSTKCDKITFEYDNKLYFSNLPVWVIFSLEHTLRLSKGPILELSKFEEELGIVGEPFSPWRRTTSLNITEDRLRCPWANGGDNKFVGLYKIIRKLNNLQETFSEFNLHHYYSWRCLDLKLTGLAVS